MNAAVGVGGHDLVVCARVAPSAAADGQRGDAAVQAAELDVDLQAGHGSRERGVDLADEVGLVILVFWSPTMPVSLAAVGVITKVVIDRRHQGLQAEVLDEVLRRRLAGAGREDAGEEAVRAGCRPGR